MSMDGTSRARDSALARFLVFLVRRAIRARWLTVSIGLLGLVISLWLSSNWLGYRTSRAALLDERAEYHQHWLKYVAEFGTQEDVLVVVQGENRQAIIPAVDDMVSRLSAEPEHFQAVLHEIDLTKLRDKGLYYLSTAELQNIEGFLGEVDPIIRGGWEWLNPGAMAAGMAARLQREKPEQLQQAIAGAQVKLAQLAESLLTALHEPGVYKSPWPELSSSAAPLIGLTSHRLIIGNDRIGLVLLKLTPDNSQSFVPNTAAVNRLRQLVDGVKLHHAGVSIGLAGLPIMEHDEMEHSQSSMSLATALSFLGVFLVLVAGFGGIRHSLMAMASLLGTGLAAGLHHDDRRPPEHFQHRLRGRADRPGHQLRHLFRGPVPALRKLGIDRRRTGEDRGQRRARHHAQRGDGGHAFFWPGSPIFAAWRELGRVAGGGIVLCWPRP